MRLAAGNKILDDMDRDLVINVAKDGVFLGGKVVKERAAGYVRLFADLFHGVAVAVLIRGGAGIDPHEDEWGGDQKHEEKVIGRAGRAF